MMNELANCTRCHTVFAKMIRSICPVCFEEEEKAFEVVYHYLRKRKNKEATLSEIVKATGVDESFIIKFIRENRLRTTQFPNLSFPCAKCGASIVTGQLCEECSQHLIKELDVFEADSKRRKELKDQVEEKEKEIIYYSFGKNKK